MTTNALRIREATLADRDIVRCIGRETYVEHFAHIWSPEAMERYMEREFSAAALSASLAAPDAHQWCLVFNAGGEAIGFSKVNWSRAEPVTGAVGAELQKIYFRASAVGKGYGSELLAYVVEQAARRAEPLVWLNVLNSNVAGQRFYVRHGFSETGENVFQTDTGPAGMKVMQRRLDGRRE